MIIFGSSFSIVCSRTSSLVSQNIEMFERFNESLSPLSLTWDGDSSPDTYSTSLAVERKDSISSISVDFPIPGSPPISTEDGSITPPPRTLSSSSKPVERRTASSDLISDSFTTRLSRESEGGDALDLLVALTISSSNEFQLLHSGQRPIHFDSVCPHSEQTYLF